jgi:hypothetical protein
MSKREGFVVSDPPDQRIEAPAPTASVQAKSLSECDLMQHIRLLSQRRFHLLFAGLGLAAPSNHVPLSIPDRVLPPALNLPRCRLRNGSFFYAIGFATFSLTCTLYHPVQQS